jgi:hypothetical protein
MYYIFILFDITHPVFWASNFELLFSIVGKFRTELNKMP